VAQLDDAEIKPETTHGLHLLTFFCNHNVFELSLAPVCFVISRGVVLKLSVYSANKFFKPHRHE